MIFKMVNETISTSFMWIDQQTRHTNRKSVNLSIPFTFCARKTSLAYFRLNKLPHTIYWNANLNFRYVRLCDLYYQVLTRLSLASHERDRPRFLGKMAELFENSGHLDQTPQNAASDLGLHCLLVNPLGTL